MGSDPFENIDVYKSRFVSSLLTAAFLFEIVNLLDTIPIYPQAYCVRDY